jgi:hypothetical protein
MKFIYPFTASAFLIASPLAAQTGAVNGPAAGLPVVLAPGTNWHPTTGSATRGGGAPVNDDCSNVPDVSLPSGGSITFTGDNTGATATNDFEPGSILEGVGPCVWHTFTTSACNNVTVSYCATDPVFSGVAAFLSPACPTGADYQLYFSYNYDDCGNGNGTIQYVALPAGTWYLPVMMNSFVGAVGPYNILVTAEACEAPPANDDCANAISLVPAASCSFEQFTTAGATLTLPAMDCGGQGAGFANDDVWFSFTATNAQMTVQAVGADDGDGNTSTGFNAVLEAFSGGCDNLQSIGCVDDSVYSQAEQLLLSGLTVGQDYLVRVFDWNPGYPAVPDFGICVLDHGVNAIAEQGLDRRWMLFPNPASSALALRWNGSSGPATVDVMDLAGRTMRTLALELHHGQDHPIPLTGLAAGDYLLRLEVQGERSVRHVALP